MENNAICSPFVSNVFILAAIFVMTTMGPLFACVFVLLPQ